ncbi:MAG: alpha-L-rhamnosidase C-terminal domain-containing protein [Bacteroidales bacterium]
MSRIFVLLILFLIVANSFGAIITSKNIPGKGEWVMFRGNIHLEKYSGNSKIMISADSKYWLWINNELVIREGGLKRGPNPVDSYIDVLDNVSQLRKGENNISILVWYFGKDSFSHRSSPVGGVSFKLTSNGLTYESDSSWRAKKHGGFFTPNEENPNYRLSESNIGYDSRLDEPFFMNEYDDSLWEHAKVILQEQSGWGEYVERPIPQWKDFGLKNYEKVYREGNKLIAQLPYNAQIMPYIKLRSRKGNDTIDIRTDNYRGGGATNVFAKYVTKQGDQEWESYGWMNGHQVIYTISEDVDIEEVKYRESGYDTELAGSFTCSDQFLNRLWDKSQRTLYITMRDTYMDCPDRERAQWWGDVVIELGEAFYALDQKAHLLTRKGIRELMDWQKPDSVIFSPVPAGSWSQELPMQMLASVGYYGFWTYYIGSGDIETIKYVYPKVKKYIEVWKVDNKGFVIPRKGGWTWGDWGDNKDLELLYNLWYVIALDGFERMSLLVGNNENAEWASLRSVKLKKIFHERFWNKEIGAYRSEKYEGKTDDRAQALAVLCEIAPKDIYKDLLAIFKQEFHASPYMEKYVSESLCKMGEYDYALTRIKKRYGDMVHSSYSTLWEGWGIGKDGFGGGSYNHAWSGGPLTIMSQYIAGISIVEPSFSVFKVNPNIGRLGWIRSSTPTPGGFIHLYVSESQNQMRMSLQVPSKSQAIVVVKSEYHKIKINGKQIPYTSEIKLKAGDYNIIMTK